MANTRKVEMLTAEQYRKIETAVQKEAKRRPDKKGETWRIKKLNRYWCFRLQNEAQGGCVADDPSKPPEQRPPEGFKEEMESTLGFTEWADFADIWDLHPARPNEIVHRTVSVWHEHEARMRALVPVLPVIKKSDSRGDRVIKRAALQLLSTKE